MRKLSETLKELGIKFTFPIKINDTNGNETYYENSDGNWWRFEYESDANGDSTYYENSNGMKVDTPRSEEPSRDEIIAAVNEFATWMLTFEEVTISYYLKGIDGHADRAVETLDALLLQKNK